MINSRVLGIDIETRCDKDLSKCSVYSYVEDDSFEVLLFAYAFDDEDVCVVDVKNGEVIPEYVVDAIYDDNVIKSAFNANFERVCLSKFFNRSISISSFRCTMVNALYLGLPGSLDKVGDVLKLDKQKMSEGRKLIKLFCTSKPSVYGGPLWDDFKSYCKRDVEVEREIRKFFRYYPLPDSEYRFYVLDQIINDRGVLIDDVLIDSCLRFSDVNNIVLRDKLSQISDIKNPKSVKEVKDFLQSEFGFYVSSLSGAVVKDILDSDVCDGVKDVLRLRKEICKTSLKKFDAMKKCVCDDGRIRGLLQFYGANRTGRWAGRLVQVHNLPQNKMSDLNEFREYVKSFCEDVSVCDVQYVRDRFGNVSELLPQLIRTAFVPKEDHSFVIADFSAIEARIIAWLSGEDWRNQVFRSHGKIYEASAARMFNVDIDDVKPGSELRQKGKIAELALGYQGGKGALLTMGAGKMGISDGDIEELVKRFRKENVNIVKLWKDVESSAIKAVECGCSVNLGCVSFVFSKGILFIKLPSGRSLCYVRPRIEQGVYGKKLSYEGVNQTTKRWERIDTYGGKLVENIVQGIARDCLSQVMVNLYDAGFDIVMHVHDEVVIEHVGGDFVEQDIKDIMERNISWASGLCLKVDLFSSDFYKKG